MDVLAAASTAPWLGSGLFTVLGGLGAGLVAQSVAVYLSRRKSREDMENRERAQRREALIDFLAAANHYIVNYKDKTAHAVFQSSYVRAELVLPTGIRELVQAYYDVTYDYGEALEDRKDTDELKKKWLDIEPDVIRAARKAHLELGLPRHYEPAAA